ncbi:hypothetical protein BH20ACT5_BH20ACT5_14910 [soil metagenome]
MTGRLVIMGSGETSPTMIKAHRELFELIGAAPAVLLDTPYGFQENADEISAKAQRYFRDSVGCRVDVVSWREGLDGVPREQALAALRAAGWVFAGPGSPTYALRQWAGTPVPGLLADTVCGGSVVVFASAATLTLGSHTVPVYEIYKAGEPAGWVPGLDLVRSLTGLPAVVIPHYDNAEGGHHDTRFCYLGERRLARMEAALPAETFVLGVDEHTGCVLDPAAGTATVIGHGSVTVRRRGANRVFPSGAVVGFAELPTGSPELPANAGAAAPPPDHLAVTSAGTTSLRAEADAREVEFVAALDRGDAQGCVAAVLALEQILVDWSADTLTSDEGEHARGLLRSMVLRLGELAGRGVRDTRPVVAPYVETLLSLRATARSSGDFAIADRARDGLTAAGVEVRDTPAGTEWSLRE